MDDTTIQQEYNVSKPDDRKWTLKKTGPHGSTLRILPTATQKDYDEVHSFLNQAYKYLTSI